MQDYLLWTEQEILEAVDEYCLYCSYLDFEPMIGAKYISPIRSSTGSSLDTDPSFGIYERKYGKGSHEFMWKDQALGVHGDVFGLIQRVCNLRTRQEALWQVLIDLGLMNGQQARKILDGGQRKHRGYAKILYTPREFTHRDLLYWNRINVTPSLLQRYNVHSVAAYWLYEEQQWPRYPRGLGFAYNVWDKVQLYQPWAPKELKFRTDWIESCVPGFLQLEYNQPLLIIQKACKDVLCTRSFGYEVVAPRGESILIPDEFMAYFKSKYRRIVSLFDNDGKHKGQEYVDRWDVEMLQVPKLLDGDKDTTDFCTNHGACETSQMLRQITGT